ncbi:MAG: sulfatase family protein [Anaerolineae bacterium]
MSERNVHVGIKGKPNLLFIFTDEQRADTLGCYGNRLVQTPNLDRLAADSFVFENAYVTQSVCTPSRSSIMTGLYPHTTGCTRNNIPLRPDTPTIAEMVSSDYLCGYYGKWHLGDEVVAQHGFEDWVSIEDTYRRYYTRPEYLSRFSSYYHFLIKNGFEPDEERGGAVVFSRRTAAGLAEEFTKARFLGREAARFIRSHANHPFILYVNFLEPHPPTFGPLDDLYRPDELPLGPTFNRQPADDAARINQVLARYYMSRHDEFGEDLRTEIGLRRLRAKYLGLVTLVDRAVGDILQALEDSGQADRTIVVFTSDHGDMMGDHGLIRKCVNYEEAIKAPLIIRVPWLDSGGRRIEGRVSQIDLVPTLLDLLGEPIPNGLQGVSRADVLRGRATLADNDVFFEWNGTDSWEKAARSVGLSDEEWEQIHGPWRSVISAEGWKLNLSPVDRCELYNLNEDPYEQHNRFDDPACRAEVDDLTDRIRRWQARTGDDAPLPER